MSRQLALVVVVVLASAGCGGGSGNPTLTVVLAGTASEGSVTSDVGIDCGTACTLDLPPNVHTVPLAAVVPPGVVFVGWDGGGCTGNATDCMVTIAGDVTVTATFDQKLATVEVRDANHQIDLLIVNANDVSTLEEQNSLRYAIPAFIDDLQGSLGEPPDLHVGVVTTDMGALGVELSNPGCTDSDGGNLVKGFPSLPNQCPTIADSYIASSAAATNYTGDFSGAVACLAYNGDRGCGFEQPLEAIRTALNSNPNNAGFLRPSALLAILVRADQDDCSVKDPAFFGPETPALGPLTAFRCFEKGIRCAEGRDVDLRAVGAKTDCVVDDASTYLYGVQGYVDFLHALKADPRDVIVGVLSGEPSPVIVGTTTPMGGTPRPDLIPSCDWRTASGTSTADPGIRLAAFANAFDPDRGLATNECNEDLSPQLHAFENLLRRAAGYPCLDGELYAPDACTLAYADGTTIAHCTAALDNPPCWHVEVDATACAASQTRIVIEDPAPPPDADVTGTCRIN